MAELRGNTLHTPQASSTNGERVAARILDAIRDTVTTRLSGQRDRATDGLGIISQAVRQSTHQLRGEEHHVIARYVERAADQMDLLSEHLRDRDVGDLLGDLQRLARRRPAVFVAGAFALGFIGGRFIKGSSDATHRTRH